MDTITINNLMLQVIIGVYEDEQKAPQPLSLDIAYTVNAEHVALTDDMADTIDYAAIYAACISFVESTRYRLLETLAERLAEHLQATFHLTWVRLSITKKPSSMPDAAGVTIVIERP